MITSALVGVFAGTHLVLATNPIREWILDRIGSVKFAVMFSFIAWITFGVTASYYAAHRHEGPPGLGWSGTPGVSESAIVLMVLGVVLMVSIVAPSGYLESAAVVFGRHSNEPRGLERVTRHPFFVGLALYAIGHVMVASRMMGVVVFGTFAGLAVVGGLMQDRKLLADRGDEHAAYLKASSFVPFWAIVRRRQRLVVSELPWLYLVLGGGMAWGMRWLHGTSFASEYGALLVIVTLVVVPAWFAFQSAFRHHRARSSL